MRRALVLLMVLVCSQAAAQVSVRTVDFLKGSGMPVNGAGPLLLKMDEARNRLIVANTLSSSVSIIDCDTRNVDNIPVGGRALQHLKNESLALDERNGDIYLIGVRCFSVIHPDDKRAETFPTAVQFESVAVDDASGNAFLVGRESKDIAFYKPGAKSLVKKPWVEHREDLINMNATPPPPIRKVVADPVLGRVFAVDGFTSTLYTLDARNAKMLGSRPIPLASGGRWHLGGYDDKTRSLYIVTETAARKVIQAARIDVEGTSDVVVPLPEFTEGVGILHNPARREVYIPYDNHPSVHVVSFENGGTVEEIKIPAYGNDASALDDANGILYIGSWAHGEVDVIDLQTRKLVKRIEDLGIIPHMFAMAFDPKKNLVYFPKGASAVNGTFGAAVTVLDPATEKTEKIRTGWAPIDLIEVPSRKSFLVFDTEDEFAEVHADGVYQIRQLPFDYPICASPAPDGGVYLSYGPHQSYWPVVYIWGAKNGVLGIDADDLRTYDRRIPRQAHKIVLDKNGVAYFTQNNWGEEEQFIGTLGDPVRLFDIDRRIRLRDKVTREITQRILSYDPDRHSLYLVRIGENDIDPSMLQVVDLAVDSVTQRIPLGLTATSLCDDGERIFVSNFDSNTVSAVDKATFAVETIPTGKQPLKLCRAGSDVYVIDHGDNTIEKLTGGKKTTKIPFRGVPDNLFSWDDKLVVTSHNKDAVFIGQFDPASGSLVELHKAEYPYGDTRFDSGNVSFYVRGQFGDAVFSLTEGKVGKDGRLWITDFLSGRLFILEKKG
jgi:YVTN family beta-propeller protein